MEEFYAERKRLGYPNPVEVTVSDEEIDLLLPQHFKQSSADNWARVLSRLHELRNKTDKKDQTSSTAPVVSEVTVGSTSELSLERKGKYTGTFGCHGLGGALRGALNLFEAKQGYDNEVEAIKSVAQTFPNMKQLGDIRLLNNPTRTISVTDLFHCGPPCQAFSPLGFLRGLADPRGALYLETARMAVTLGFKITIIEMVSNIL